MQTNAVTTINSSQRIQTEADESSSVPRSKISVLGASTAEMLNFAHRGSAKELNLRPGHREKLAKEAQIAGVRQSIGNRI